jgi:hypothetical protein
MVASIVQEQSGNNPSQNKIRKYRKAMREDPHSKGATLHDISSDQPGV